MLDNFVGILLAAFFVTLVITPVMIRLSVKTGFMDFPLKDALKIHSTPMPLLGGVATALASLVSLGLATFVVNTEVDMFLGLAGGLCLLFVLGLCDDYRGVNPFLRLAGQLIVVALFLSTSGLIMPFLPNPVWNVIVSGLFLLLMINAMNLLDGMDGLATGISLVAALGFLLGFTATENVPGILLSLTLLGTCAAFLIYNFEPAKIFLGDSGSTVFGFQLGVLALLYCAQANSPVQLLTPLFILVVPVLDVSAAILRRSKRNMSFLHGDRDHLYDQLQRAGLSQRQTVLVMYSLGLCGALAAVYVF